MSAIERAQSTDPIKLNHALQCMKSLKSEGKMEEAIKIGKEAFDLAISELDSVSDEDYKQATFLMQMIRDEITEMSQEPK
jgi:hypothetical protein